MKGRYTLSPDSFPYIEIHVDGNTYVNRRRNDEKILTPQAIQIELPNGNFIELEQLVDHYMKQWQVNEPASPIDNTPAFLRKQAD